MIKNFEPRLYQQTVVSTCVDYNTLVILPTGMGKTNIFLMLAAHRLRNYPNSKILLLGPTRPLIDQYLDVFRTNFDIAEDQMAIFTGMISPEKRQKLWQSSKIIFSTPQGLENDLISGKISLEDVSLIGFDESHRAVGDYSYVFIAKNYYNKAKYPRILGLTASPGHDLEKISEVCRNLFIEEIEIRTEDDPDVKPYIQDVAISWVKVELPDDFRLIQKNLKHCFDSKLQTIKDNGYIKGLKSTLMGKKELLSIMGSLHKDIAGGNKDFDLMRAVSLLAEAMKVQHALELLESQGITPLFQYMEKLNNDARTSNVKAVQNLVRDLNFRTAYYRARELFEKGVEHPKLERLREMVKSELSKGQDVKIIVFNQFRDSALKIVSELKKIDGVNPVLFVGQMKKKDTGMSQKEQQEVLEKFRDNGFNVLVATSVAEEGLDIPAVDTVIFYEPVPSVIRTIQRKGRTGRQEKGKVFVLMTKGTRDEGYRWSAHHKENKMYRTLHELKTSMKLKKPRKEAPLDGFLSETPLYVYADLREKGSGIMKDLIGKGFSIQLKNLEVGDYVLSSRCAVEIKTVPDFVDSIIDGRLLSQLKELKKNFERPLVLLVGQEDIYSQRKIHPNAIRGMFSTIALSYGIPIMQAKDSQEAASLLAIMAKREQEQTSKDFNPHGSRKPMSQKELQEYIVSSLPGVGSGLAKPLLEHFGSVKKVMDASEERLQKVDKIGPNKAKEIRSILDEDY
ncbi:DEAD/DEAH box helicase [Candidatus Woesearchaeota archaeon]|nr:DEAD/DEAH box helicase [Candidatus Woesearchaeota archaeon]